MTYNEKFCLIDEYLNEGNIDPKWEVMILEYKQMLKEKQETENKRIA